MPLTSSFYAPFLGRAINRWCLRCTHIRRKKSRRSRNTNCFTIWNGNNHFWDFQSIERTWTHSCFIKQLISSSMAWACLKLCLTVYEISRTLNRDEIPILSSSFAHKLCQIQESDDLWFLATLRQERENRQPCTLLSGCIMRDHVILHQCGERISACNKEIMVSPWVEYYHLRIPQCC